MPSFEALPFSGNVVNMACAPAQALFHLQWWFCSFLTRAFISTSPPTRAASECFPRAFLCGCNAFPNFVPLYTAQALHSHAKVLFFCSGSKLHTAFSAYQLHCVHLLDEPLGIDYVKALQHEQCKVGPTYNCQPVIFRKPKNFSDLVQSFQFFNGTTTLQFSWVWLNSHSFKFSSVKSRLQFSVTGVIITQRKIIVTALSNIFSSLLDTLVTLSLQTNYLTRSAKAWNLRWLTGLETNNNWAFATYTMVLPRTAHS